MISGGHTVYRSAGRNWFALRILRGVVRKWFLQRSRPYRQMNCQIISGGTESLGKGYEVPAEEMVSLSPGTDSNVSADLSDGVEGDCGGAILSEHYPTRQ